MVIKNMNILFDYYFANKSVFAANKLLKTFGIFIFERKGVFKMFDLKTISGKTSASSRLLESIGQANHVVLNMKANYSPRLLAKDVQFYFEANKEAREVLIIKGNKFLSVSRQFVEGKDYIKMFIKRYLK